MRALVHSNQLVCQVLTSLPRKEWAAARDELCQFSPKNSVALGTIDSALFVLVLDDYCPSDANETAANMLHGTYKMDPNFNQIGTCCNRWYDKLQVIVCANGTAGVNFEHSSIDGHTALRFVSDIMAETIVVFAQSITKLIHGIGHLPHVIDAEVKRAALTLDENGAPWLDVFPKRVSFSFPPRVLDKIYYAETALGDEIVASDTVVLEFAKYGKSLIVSNKLSPDSFVQMTMILAYYRLYGKVVCTYEPVLTKTFYHGRTEAMRSATPEAAEFCRVWCSDAPRGEKLHALRKATEEHSRLVAESARGKGVDRHLFALKCIAHRNNIPTPKFFESHPWKTLNHTVLSTSNCGNPALRLFGFGPVVPDGLG
jgi:carnitine O-acetyltransferase